MKQRKLSESTGVAILNMNITSNSSLILFVSNLYSEDIWKNDLGSPGPVIQFQPKELPYQTGTAGSQVSYQAFTSL